jgi:hypothetical protein
MTTNNRSISLVAALAVAGSFAASSPAHATVAQAASFEEKVDHAAGIVLGKVVNTRSAFDPSGRWIVTYSTFRVENVIKGQPAAEVTVVTPGGHVGNVNQSTIGIPVFNSGDERVVFLKNTKLGPTVLYFDQGTYEVRNDERGERLVAPVQSDLVTVDGQTGKAITSEDAEHPKTLREFQEAVRNAERTRQNRVEMNALAQRAKQQPGNSLADILARNKMVIAIAAIGAIIAAWQLSRKS